MYENTEGGGDQWDWTVDTSPGRREEGEGAGTGD